MLITLTGPSDEALATLPVPDALPTPSEALDLLHAYQEDLPAALQRLLLRLQRSGDLEQGPVRIPG